jgi:hypothetical protein
MEANQNTTNINGKKDKLPTVKLLIGEIVCCGLATKSVNIVIEMPIVENSICYRVDVDRNQCYRRALKNAGYLK